MSSIKFEMGFRRSTRVAAEFLEQNSGAISALENETDKAMKSKGLRQEFLQAYEEVKLIVKGIGGRPNPEGHKGSEREAMRTPRILFFYADALRVFTKATPVIEERRGAVASKDA